MSIYRPGSLSESSSIASQRVLSPPLSPRSSLVSLPSTMGNDSVVLPLSPRSLSPRSLSPRSAMPSLKAKVEKMEKVAHKVMEMGRESNDVNMVVDHVIDLIDSYGNNSKIMHVLVEHSMEKIHMVLLRVALIYLVRMELLKVLVVLEQYHLLKERFGEREVKHGMEHLIKLLSKKLKKLKYNDWVDKIAAMFEK